MSTTVVLNKGVPMNVLQARKAVRRLLPTYLTEGQPPVEVKVRTEWVLGLGVRWVAVAYHDERHALAIGVACERADALAKMVEDSGWWASWCSPVA